jgi:hypothetical protein
MVHRQEKLDTFTDSGKESHTISFTLLKVKYERQGDKGEQEGIYDIFSIRCKSNDRECQTNDREAKVMTETPKVMTGSYCKCPKIFVWTKEGYSAARNQCRRAIPKAPILLSEEE